MGSAESQLRSPVSPECDALVCITQILGKRATHPPLLSDLGALLPERHFQFIKEKKGRLRKWILQYPIFALTGPRGSEHVTLNFEFDDDVKDEVFVKLLNKQHTVSEEEVVMAEDLLDKLLENVLDLIDQVSNLRKQVDARIFPSSDKLNAAIESVGGF